jgi:hypothetical protein
VGVLVLLPPAPKLVGANSSSESCVAGGVYLPRAQQEAAVAAQRQRWSSWFSIWSWGAWLQQSSESELAAPKHSTPGSSREHSACLEAELEQPHMLPAHIQFFVDGELIGGYVSTSSVFSHVPSP